MEFLRLLEQIRTPLLDQIMALLTHLGSELVFMVMAVAIYWCVSKSRGMYVLAVGCLGTTINQFLKLAFRVPRPWVKDPSFTIVESARADATGYSFPSGHTQNVAGTFGCLAKTAQKRGVRIALVVVILLVAFTRMYLGVHTPADVGVSLLVAAVLVVGMEPLFRDADRSPKRVLWILVALTAVNMLYLAYANFWPFPADMDVENLSHGVENAAKLTGALLGMLAGVAIDLKWVRFRTRAPLLGQILKCVLGLALVLAIKEGLKPVLGSGNLSAAVRYACVTVFAGGIWPMTFPFFAKLGRKKERDL